MWQVIQEFRDNALEAFSSKTDYALAQFREAGTDISYSTTSLQNNLMDVARDGAQVIVDVVQAQQAGYAAVTGDGTFDEFAAEIGDLNDRVFDYISDPSNLLFRGFEPSEIIMGRIYEAVADSNPATRFEASKLQASIGTLGAIAQSRSPMGLSHDDVNDLGQALADYRQSGLELSGRRQDSVAMDLGAKVAGKASAMARTAMGSGRIVNTGNDAAERIMARANELARADMGMGRDVDIFADGYGPEDAPYLEMVMQDPQEVDGVVGELVTEFGEEQIRPFIEPVERAQNIFEAGVQKMRSAANVTMDFAQERVQVAQNVVNNTFG